MDLNRGNYINLNRRKREHTHSGNNLLAGIISSDLGAMSSLQVLTLGSNKLAGSIPTSLEKLSNLLLLLLSQNSLVGIIPSVLGFCYHGCLASQSGLYKFAVTQCGI
eukprot:gene14790-31429_t